MLKEAAHMEIALFLIFIVPAAIVIDYLIASAFEKIAAEKGYSSVYFWWCFFMGLAGWIMVAALPNRKANPPVPSASDKGSS